MAGLDRHDLGIPRVPQRDGRVAKVRPAELVRLTPSPCRERPKRPETARLAAPEEGTTARVMPPVIARAEVGGVVEVTRRAVDRAHAGLRG